MSKSLQTNFFYIIVTDTDSQIHTQTYTETEKPMAIGEIVQICLKKRGPARRNDIVRGLMNVVASVIADINVHKETFTSHTHTHPCAPQI